MCISFSLSTFLFLLLTWLSAVFLSSRHHHHHLSPSFTACSIPFHEFSSKNLEFNIRRTLNFLFPPDIVLFLLLPVVVVQLLPVAVPASSTRKTVRQKGNSRKMNKMSAVIEVFLLHSPVRESLQRIWNKDDSMRHWEIWENVFYRKLQFYLLSLNWLSIACVLQCVSPSESCRFYSPSLSPSSSSLPFCPTVSLQLLNPGIIHKHTHT